MFERLFALKNFGIKLGLSTITRLCESLGHPERAFRTVHIAGTNGKGSVAAMVHAGLMNAGLQAALYTSPHLNDLAERFVIGRDPVKMKILHDTTEYVLDQADALVCSGTLQNLPTFFEATTAIAFELFRRSKVDTAVIEVGLGGRYDASNIIKPALSSITSIGLDHQQQLGNSLTSIATEKAGIIKTGIPVVTGLLSSDVASHVSNVAAKFNSVVIPAFQDVSIESRYIEGRSFLKIRTPQHQYAEIPLALRGIHQEANAIVAIRIMETLNSLGIEIPYEAIERALREVKWPGRLELIMLDRARRVLLDAAHNPDGAAALARYLSQWYIERPPLIFAAMNDKDVTGMLRKLLPVVGPVIVTGLGNTRAMDPETIENKVIALEPEQEVIKVNNPTEALKKAFLYGSMVCVTGSFLLVGTVRKQLQHRAILQ